MGDAALRGVALALHALVAMRLWSDLPPLPVARTGVRLALGLCLQLIGAAPWVEAQAPAWLQAPPVAVAVGNAVVFWLFVRACFDDDFKLAPWRAAVWALAAGLGGLNCLLEPWHASVITPVLLGAQRVIPLVFARLGVQAALRQWRDNLVEPRRQLRRFVLAAGVVYTVLQVGARLASTNGRLALLAALWPPASRPPSFGASKPAAGRPIPEIGQPKADAFGFGETAWQVPVTVRAPAAIRLLRWSTP